ncbi:rhomboid family intramembrane serine protease [Kitasatospora sp. NA04385]|uniref:rhomboid family intramembrane serine protease n=1 Tax=Kitasatospora sp. NA04385 TaxID=2742135 RepID=UPI0020CADB29|nr:rhomboid family intramembrane serine protease [Kitasatospora sp. NA04385]
MRPTPADGQGTGGGLPGCHRHPERETGVSCARCGRPVCPECMVPASVGFQCPDCVHGAEARQERDRQRPRTSAGALLALGDGALVTKALIGINLAVFLLTEYLAPALFGDLALRSIAPLPGLRLGVAEGPGEWYRLVSAMFVHAGVLHVAMNMFSLWVLGPQLERVLGRLRFLALYLVSGLAGNAFAYLLAPPDRWLNSVGASGAIFGLLGATAVLFKVSRTPMQPVIALLVVNLVLSFSLSGIDWRAHLGGLVAGAAVGAGMFYAPRERRNLVQGLAVAGGLALTLVMLLVGTARLPG